MPRIGKKVCIVFVTLTVLPLLEFLASGVENERAHLLQQQLLAGGEASQGVALADDNHHYYGATHESICRFDSDWNLIEEKPIRIKGVNHLGAIDYHNSFIWAGFLNSAIVKGKHDPQQNRSIIAKICAKELTVVQTWDISGDVNWIDPVCFDGQYLWVGDASDLGIHRYQIVGNALIRDAIFRYPQAMHFSQGIRVVANKLYSIHTFGSMDGLFEFEIPETIEDRVNRPTRVWQIQETKMHLEGFDFVPGYPNEIWHAQGMQVDRYRLEGLPGSSDGGKE